MSYENNILFTGTMPALITPFEKNGKIKKNTVKGLVDWHLSEGSKGFYICGSTGEGPALTAAMRMEMAEATMDAVAGRGVVIDHIGAPNIWDAIALTEHSIVESTILTCTGKYQGSFTCSTYSDTHWWGGIDVIDAIAYSCNSFFCELGNRLGIQKMEQYLALFGLGESTGLELGGAKGILAGPTYRAEHAENYAPDDVWGPGLTWQAAVGQQHQLSPMQIACYIGTLCNGGTRYTAHLLHSVYRFGSDEPSFVYQQTEDTVLSRIEIAQDDLDTIFEGMKKMITETTFTNNLIGNNDNIPVTVGGKTGTAEKGTEDNPLPSNALFVASAPYDDPDIVISVVLEDGAHGYYCAITATRILEAYYSKS